MAGPAGVMAGPVGVAGARPAAGAAAARQAFGLAVGLLGQELPGAAVRPEPGGSAPGVRVFSGDLGRVRAVRAFVRAELSGHPACTDALMTVSELAANAVQHSLSSRDRGRFVVQAFAFAAHAGLVVTDQGGPAFPLFPAVPAHDAVSGRGLQVVRALACWLRVHDHPGGARSVAAAIPGTCGPGRACRPADWIELGW